MSDKPVEYTPISAEEIVSNYDKFLQLCGSLGDRGSSASKLVEFFGERLAVCPASAKKQYHNAFPGGLIDHSLRVLSNAAKLVKSFGLQVNKESLVLACLFHDIGKVGDVEQPLYIDQKSSYKIQNGSVYDYNSNMQYMSSTHRTLFLLQRFGITLAQDEFLAILLCDGFNEEMKPYILKEPSLATVVHQADYWAALTEKMKHEGKETEA